METHRLVIPYGSWKRQILLGWPVVAFLSAIVWDSVQQEGWPFYLVMLFFALVLSIFVETEIDQLQSVIIRRWSLFKIIPLRRKRCLISDFASIGRRFKDDADDDRTWHVHLQAKSGRPLDIKWFGYAKEPPTEALKLQRQLSDMTGLPIRNEIH